MVSALFSIVISAGKEVRKTIGSTVYTESGKRMNVSVLSPLLHKVEIGTPPKIPKTRSPLQIVDNLSISSFFVKFTPELKTVHRLGRIRDHAQKKKNERSLSFSVPFSFSCSVATATGCCCADDAAPFSRLLLLVPISPDKVKEGGLTCKPEGGRERRKNPT